MPTELPLIRRLHHYSEMASVLFGFLLNTALLRVALKNKDRGLKSFNQIVIMNCIMDLCFAATTLISELVSISINSKQDLQECETHQGTLFFFTNSYFAQILPNHWHYLLIYTFCIGIGLSVLYVPIPFYHRYMLICRGVALSRKRIFCILLIPIVCSVYISGIQLYTELQAEARREEFIPFINNSVWAGSTFLVFPLDSLPAYVYFFNSSFAFMLSWAIPFFLFGKIYQKFLETKATMSAQTCKLHQSLHRALISQALLPFFLGSLPCGIAINLLVIGVDIPYLPIIAISTVSWIPAANAFMTMVFIPAYLRAMLPAKLVKHSVKISSVKPLSSIRLS